MFHHLGREKRKIGIDINPIDGDDLLLLKKHFDLVTLVIVFFIVLLVLRLWFLQIHRGEEYKRMAENNRVRTEDVIAPRGKILDRHEKVIVSNRPSFNILWYKDDAPDPDLIIKRIARIVNEDIAVLLGRIRAAADRPRHLPLRLKEDIDWNVLAYIENNNFELPGIRIEVLPRREYLFGGLASHLIGYLGEINQQELIERQWDNYKGGEQLGKRGIEKLYESYLRGEKGRQYMEVNALGFEQRRLKGLETLPGDDVQLTLDLAMQQTAEKALAGKAGAVVAMEVDTGRLLVLASSPPLNPEDFIGGISHQAWDALNNNPLLPLVNKTIQGEYPPGSIYKVVTAMAGLAEGVITPETTFNCTGSITYGDRRYGCWKEGGHGKVSLHRALAESCDVYFYRVGQQLGVDTLARYASSFGLGAKTGVELEYERSGLVPTADWKKRRYRESWQKGETLSVAIGQGFNLVTPLQICQMIMAIANGGILYRPQLIEAVIDPAGNRVQQFKSEVMGEILGGTKELQLIQQGLMAAVNDEHGTGREARLAGVKVAGKTGTAQVVRLAQYENLKEEDIPYRYRDHAWFACYAPAEEPKIAVAVLVEHGLHGGSAAAPIAREVLRSYFNRQQESARVAEDSGQAMPARRRT